MKTNNFNSIMSRILAKQVNNLLKEDLPNISIVVDQNNITKLDVIFCYQKTDGKDEHPIFYPKGRTDRVFLKGSVDLNGFPNNPPKLTLSGPVAHSHVYLENNNRYKICFSLDESFQWYFGGKHMKSSKFNPSVSIKYYLQAVYKFLAEDDLEHPITEDAKERCIEYWNSEFKHNPKEFPKNQVSYYEALAGFNETKKKSKVVSKNEFKDFPEDIWKLNDFVDKEPLLNSDVPIVYGISYEKKGQRYIYKVAGFDLMKETTFQDGVRKTSVGAEFNERFPIVIHSKFWKKVQPEKILDDLVNNAFKRVRTNQIIKLNGKVEVFDHYLYIISELFNELAIDVFFGEMFPCEEVLKGFVYFHHLLLVLEKNHPDIMKRGELILDFFEKDPKNRDKKICPNLGILMTQYLMSKKERDNIKLIDEMLSRNVLWSLMKVKDCQGAIRWDKTKNKFVIENMDKWIDLTWENSAVGMQRFAFQQLYNNRFKNETLDSMDSKFGQVPAGEIEVFQQEVKKLNKWNELKGLEGYKTFLEYYDVKDYDLKKKLDEALERSHNLGYHSFVVKKQWFRYTK